MMASKLGTMFALALLTASPALPQQPAPAPQEQMHMQLHDHMQMVEPVYPWLGRPQEQSPEKLFTLDDAQRIASTSNPTLRQAEAEIRAAKARTQQAGLYPNPSIGYTGDEIRGGSINGGKQGFFVEQSVVTGGKLGKARAVFEQEERVAELEAEEQKTRVETSVKIAFYHALAAQELLELRRDLSQIGQMRQESESALVRTGQFDESELLQTQIEVQRLHLAALEQENALREQWRRLAAVIGQPDLPQATVAGDLEHGWTEVNEQQILKTIASLSPTTRIAEASAARANAEFARAKSQVIPDINALGGLEYNNEPLGSVPPHSIGWEGLAELSVQVPIFNRNQGNIAEARADLDRAQLEKQRVQLLLRERAASLLDQYATAKVVATQYREQILPLAKQANTLMTEKYGQMLAAYPRMLEARRKNFELATEYVQTLEIVWTTSFALQGFLFTDGLAAPASSSEILRSTGETNPPSLTRKLMPTEEMPLP